jgi:hypothetical protein
MHQLNLQCSAPVSSVAASLVMLTLNMLRDTALPMLKELSLQFLWLVYSRRVAFAHGKQICVAGHLQ